MTDLPNEPPEESEPWSEGYLAQRELALSLGTLLLPGEYEEDYPAEGGSGPVKVEPDDSERTVAPPES